MTRSLKIGIDIILQRLVKLVNLSIDNLTSLTENDSHIFSTTSSFINLLSTRQFYLHPQGRLQKMGVISFKCIN